MVRKTSPNEVGSRSRSSRNTLITISTRLSTASLPSRTHDCSSGTTANQRAASVQLPPAGIPISRRSASTHFGISWLVQVTLFIGHSFHGDGRVRPEPFPFSWEAHPPFLILRKRQGGLRPALLDSAISLACGQPRDGRRRAVRQELLAIPALLGLGGLAAQSGRPHLLYGIPPVAAALEGVLEMKGRARRIKAPGGAPRLLQNVRQNGATAGEHVADDVNQADHVIHRSVDRWIELAALGEEVPELRTIESPRQPIRIPNG